MHRTHRRHVSLSLLASAVSALGALAAPPAAAQAIVPPTPAAAAPPAGHAAPTDGHGQEPPAGRPAPAPDPALGTTPRAPHLAETGTTSRLIALGGAAVVLVALGTWLRHRARHMRRD
ncbi:hypothetical protein AB0C93_29700 [Streptomyces sp. NPDC048518]|uniref:hypothetical protein n=1 Tax=Streptomyces sp. NPDC048518 TaxID=3155029 RepID=UPI0033C42676